MSLLIASCQDGCAAWGPSPHLSRLDGLLKRPVKTVPSEELDHARAKPDQQAAIRESENQLQVLQEELGNQQRTVDDRGRDVMQLQKHIVRLEQYAANCLQEIQGEYSSKQ